MGRLFAVNHPTGQPPPPIDWRAAGLLYQSLNFFHRKKFGARVWKISIDAGCSCPNRDGKLATLGCTFCDPESLAPSRRMEIGSVTAQIEHAVGRLTRRHRVRQFLAYLQPGTNTYGPIDRLRQVYEEAIAHPQVIGLIVGTRPDCVGDDVLELLAEFAAPPGWWSNTGCRPFTIGPLMH